jgi:carotenoid cleavage oxygenase
MTIAEHAPPASNPYLVGNFAPVTDERDDAELTVTGAIPPALDGLLLRNGPNPVTPPKPEEYHWFLGDGMLHGVELHNGKARYRNRWVRTPDVCAALGETVPSGPPEVNGIPTKANTHVVAHAGRVYALVESSLPTEMRADLSTMGPTDFDGALSSPFTAHPKSDPVTGELHFFGYDPFGPPFLRYHVLDPSGKKLVTSTEIEIPHAVMVHDFGITATRVVLLDLPVVFDMALVGKQPFPFTWRPDNGARVGVMPREGTNADVVWIDIEPCYVYHPLNAYDDGAGNVVIDVVRYDNMFSTEVHGPGSTKGPTLDRWTIDHNKKKVSTEQLDDASQEFPRIDERLTGQPHRYGYTAEAQVGKSWSSLGSLRKQDVVAGKTERHDVGAGRAAGEPIFVPASPDAGEDEGWVLSVVYDAGRDTSDLVIVDASDFTAAPVATVHMNRRVPFGFHGSWIDRATLG